jgi:hypothetical protein
MHKWLQVLTEATSSLCPECTAFRTLPRPDRSFGFYQSAIIWNCSLAHVLHLASWHTKPGRSAALIWPSKLTDAVILKSFWIVHVIRAFFAEKSTFAVASWTEIQLQPLTAAEHVAGRLGMDDCKHGAIMHRNLEQGCHIGCLEETIRSKWTRWTDGHVHLSFKR